MSFYGNIGDASHIHFQFDKIYANRKAMDQACNNGIDNIYQGRFVLIKYDNSNNIFTGETLYGFMENDNSSFIYLDRNLSTPYVYTNYGVITVTSDNKENIQANFSNYYEKQTLGSKIFYSPLTNAAQVINNTTLYYRINNSAGAVGLNTIVYRKNISTELFDGKFYICVGKDPNSDKATWELISDYANYGEYLSNFQIDALAYGTSFDPRGYDATVWEKIYSEGMGKFIQIARLNASVPAIEILEDKPTLLPSTAYIDAKSSPELYSIHVPSHWGFRFKEQLGGSFPPSEQQVTQQYYDENTQTIKNLTVNADIYLNLKHINPKYYYTYDESTNNEILIKPTGRSGKKYNGQTELDTYEVSVHLPAVGNMISDGYDLIYGRTNTIDDINGKRVRPRDVQWYDGNDSFELKNYGNSLLGGKTYDLTTLAGNINTMHNLLGQIIVNLNTFPDADGILELSPNLIYKYENVLYRKGTETIPQQIADSEYSFTRKTISADEFKQNKYYTVKTGKTLPSDPSQWTSDYFTPINGSFDPAINSNSGRGYYLRNINSIRYTPIDLETFVSGQCYWKDGPNYYCDHSINIPKYQNRTYYRNIQTLLRHFRINYKNDGTFFTLEDNIYTSVFSVDTTNLQDYYYTITRSEQHQGRPVLYYYPNCYYYKKPGIDEWYLATEDTYNPNYSYFSFTFSDAPSYGLDANNNVIRYYPVIEREEVTFATPLTSLDSIYIRYEHQYIPYTKLNTLDLIDGKDPHTVPWVMYTISPVSYIASSIFFPGIYYEKDSDNNYILSYTFSGRETDNYYLIQSVETIEKPFYIPDKYWYQESEDIYNLDRSLSKVNNRQYYEKASLYVYYDEAQECPMGYEWNDYSSYIPPSTTLCTYQEVPALIRLSELDETTDTLYGLLLKLNSLLNNNNEIDRSLKTSRGLYNNLKDGLYQLKKLKPGEILYANDFGQIESMSLARLKQLLNNI